MGDLLPFKTSATLQQNQKQSQAADFTRINADLRKSAFIRG